MSYVPWWSDYLSQGYITVIMLYNFLESMVLSIFLVLFFIHMGSSFNNLSSKNAICFRVNNKVFVGNIILSSDSARVLKCCEIVGNDLHFFYIIFSIAMLAV